MRAPHVARWIGPIVVGTMAFAASAAPGATTAPMDAGVIMTGRQFVYAVKAGDSLTHISARFGVDVAWLAALSELEPNARLAIGQTLRVDSRHLIPFRDAVAIVINIPQRMLFLLGDEGTIRAFPVGLGRPTWPTFVGRFTINSLETNPVWDVPPSIQAEMQRAGRAVHTRVPPGPDNPLGAFWIGLDRPGFGIHGTNAPASIYRFQTHGCIRLHPDDVAELFHTVAVGSRGEIIYQPVLLARGDDGRIWLEAHPDVYRRSRDLLAVTRELASQDELEADIDWQLVRDVLRAKRGTPMDVTHRAASPDPQGTRTLAQPLRRPEAER
ncbi:MAG TPA: L,D-transpeptidase family protein [Vicinamibacterales bacterium]